MRKISRRLVLAPSLLLLAACSEDRPLVAPDLIADLPEGAIQTVVQQSPGVEPGTTVYTVRVVGRSAKVASYQGALTFTKGSVSVVSVSTPKAPDGEVHLVNSEGAAEGKIRFAAYATEAFGTDEAFSIVVRSTTAALPDLVATLDVAGSAEGQAMAGTLLRASSGIRDVNGKLLR
jgi:hypothetical protein